MSLLLLSFEKYLIRKGYTPHTRRITLQDIRRLECIFGDLDSITLEDIRRYYWLRGTKLARNHLVGSTRRYKDFRRYQREVAEDITAFFGGMIDE